MSEIATRLINEAVNAKDRWERNNREAATGRVRSFINLLADSGPDGIITVSRLGTVEMDMLKKLGLHYKQLKDGDAHVSFFPFAPDFDPDPRFE